MLGWAQGQVNVGVLEKLFLRTYSRSVMINAVVVIDFPKQGQAVSLDLHTKLRIAC
jgi:hypothetical protein